MIGRVALLGSVVAAVVVAPIAAHADVALPGAPEEEPRSETAFRREGMAVGVGLGLALLGVAGDCCELSGLGGGFSLRVGTTATPRLLFVLQLDVGAIRIEETETNNTANAQNTLTLGVQAYMPSDRVWLKGGVGFATFINRNQGEGRPEETRGGLAAMASVGYDLVQRGIFALDLELVALSGLYGGPSAIGHVGLNLAAQWY